MKIRTVSIPVKTDAQLQKIADMRGVSVEQILLDIVQSLVFQHNMDWESVAKGYEEMGAINLDWAQGNNPKPD